MNLLKRKWQLWAGLSASFLMTGSYAGPLSSEPAIRETTTEQQEILPPETLGNILEALTHQNLKMDGQGYHSPHLNFQTTGAASLSGSLTTDGIPGARGEGREMPIDDLLARAYRSVDLIEMILEERKTYALGPRLLYMENGIREVMKLSGTRGDEEALRDCLNRGLDIISLVLPVTGAAPAASAQWATNFYRSVMVLAAGLQNNGRQRILKIRSDDSKNPDEDFAQAENVVSGLTSAKYGQVYANLLYRFSTTPGTRAAKAILLMRLLAYLGHDLNKDLARREQGISRTVADISRLQNEPIYKDIIAAFRRGVSPTSAQLATLRSRTFTILSKLPERLGKAESFGEVGLP
jgi:hypothetical protein